MISVSVFAIAEQGVDCGLLSGKLEPAGGDFPPHSRLFFSRLLLARPTNDSKTHLEIRRDLTQRYHADPFLDKGLR